jgi:hypothetical protein
VASRSRADVWRRSVATRQGVRRLSLTAVLLCQLSLPTLAAAERAPDAPPTAPTYAFSAQDLMLLPGDYDVSVADTSLQAGFGAGLELSVEVYALSGVDLGAQAWMLRRDSDDPWLDTSTLSHLGVHAGPMLVRTRDVQLSAVALVGYHVVSFEDAEELTTGLGVGVLACVSLRVLHWVWVRAQLGLLAQPLGGHDASDVTLPPTGLVGFGFSLANPTP